MDGGFEGREDFSGFPGGGDLDGDVQVAGVLDVNVDHDLVSAHRGLPVNLDAPDLGSDAAEVNVGKLDRPGTDLYGLRTLKLSDFPP